MAYGRTVLVLGAILASLTTVLAEEGSGAESNNAANERMSFSFPGFGMNYNMGGLSSGDGGGGFPNIFGGGGNGSSNPFTQFLQAFSQFIPGANGNSMPSMPGMGSMNASRDRRDIHSENTEEEEQHPRSRVRRQLANAIPISCNFTTDPGAKCAGCASRHICLKGDRGYLQGCTLQKPYCNQGQCSTNPTANCFSTTTSAGTATAG